MVFHKRCIILLAFMVLMMNGCVSRKTMAPKERKVEFQDANIAALVGTLVESDKGKYSNRGKYDRGWKARATAAYRLGQIGQPAEVIVPFLIRALTDRHPRVRSSVNEALVRIGGEAVPFLIQALRYQPDSVRWYAAKALGQIGEPAVSLLIEVFMDQEEGVQARRYAIKALKKIKTPDAMRAVGVYEGE